MKAATWRLIVKRASKPLPAGLGLSIAHSRMQAVVRGGVTAAAVIHQPSCEIFEMFDDLLLLGKGGRTVYYGPQSGVQVPEGAQCPLAPCTAPRFAHAPLPSFHGMTWHGSVFKYGRL